LKGRRLPSRSSSLPDVRCSSGFQHVLPCACVSHCTLQGMRDFYLAAADDVTRYRCMRIIEAASACGASSPHDIATAAAVTPRLFFMRNLPAVNAVLVALGKSAVEGLDLPSLKSIGCDLACYRAAGFDLPSLKDAGFTSAEVKAAGCDLKSAQAAGYDVVSLVSAFGYDAVAVAGCDVSSCLLVSFVFCSAHNRALELTTPPLPSPPPHHLLPPSATAPTCT
jgi:hypothetical protein